MYVTWWLAEFISPPVLVWYYQSFSVVGLPNCSWACNWRCVYVWDQFGNSTANRKLRTASCKLQTTNWKLEKYKNFNHLHYVNRKLQTESIGSFKPSISNLQSNHNSTTHLLFYVAGTSRMRVSGARCRNTNGSCASCETSLECSIRAVDSGRSDLLSWPSSWNLLAFQRYTLQRYHMRDKLWCNTGKTII